MVIPNCGMVNARQSLGGLREWLVGLLRRLGLASWLGLVKQPTFLFFESIQIDIFQHLLLMAHKLYQRISNGTSFYVLTTAPQRFNAHLQSCL
jgi:hypothetical protein